VNENKSQEKILFPMKSIREELGLSQRELAIALGISEMTISRAERGVNEPVFTIKQTKILCKLLGKQIDELPEYLGKDFLEDGIPND
jgi:transcriptional regulator with XRE-family HTH domain